jgi:putative ABC transport system permease protein
MFRYYSWLAFRSLRRNPVLTALMVVAIALGIGATMTCFTVLYAMSGDPIPHKSTQLYAVQIDTWGPKSHVGRDGTIHPDPVDQLTYKDSVALMAAKQGMRQVAMHGTGGAITPENSEVKPFQQGGRATFADFFAMFDVPFRYGKGWTAAEDEARAAVVVLSKKLNEKIFGDVDSVGKSIDLDGRQFRVLGVLEAWEPKPRFYDVTTGGFNEPDGYYIPFTYAVDNELPQWGNNNCFNDPGPGRQNYLNSECVWTQFWVELPDTVAFEKYKTFLDSYASEAQRSGRFSWPPNNRLRNVKEWLVAQEVVPDDAKVSVLLAFSFLIVCLVNTVGLMLAKFLGRSGEIGLRRALGANKRALYAQCLVESGAIGLAGGVLGLGLVALGLAGMRGLLPEEMQSFATLNLPMVTSTIALAVLATLAAGLYPTWRAAQVQPAWQLKSN